MRPIAAFLTLLTLIAAVGCHSNPATGRNQFILISDSQAKALGVEAAPGLIQEYGGQVASPELREYVSDLGRKLASHTEEEYADVEWRFVVLDSDVINAFALPDGTVSITRALLERFSNEAQVAGVLGHEIGHVTARHVSERISRELAAQGLLTGLSMATDSGLISQAAGMFAQGYGLKFDRGQETESDALGVKYMARAGYDPKGMVQVLEVLAAAAGDARQPEILSTHPHPETRIATVQALIDGPYAYTRNNGEYTLRQGRFDRLAAPYLNRPAAMGPAILAPGCLTGDCAHGGHGAPSVALGALTGD
ncbi:MAG: M48 family metallopeptidase [Phycisphaerales bacterium]|nr:M48 family metallopeptidase [Phycisphaerales bacterium]